MIPLDLSTIYNNLLKNHRIACFRVRDVDTCMDYLICGWEHWRWDEKQRPRQMWALLLEPPFSSYYPMMVDEEVYALLSNDSELKYFGTIGSRLVPAVVIKSYKEKTEEVFVSRRMRALT